MGHPFLWPSRDGHFLGFYQDFFNFCLKIDIGIDRSENSLEPGIISIGGGGGVRH